MGGEVMTSLNIFCSQFSFYFYSHSSEQQLLKGVLYCKV